MKTRNLTTLLLTLVLAGMLMISGCGQKGDLYLPDDQKKEKKSDS